jgi:hypothetical protein
LKAIATAAAAEGRSAHDITIIAVTKSVPWSSGMQLYAAGQRHFAENRLQIALPKMAEAPGDVQWHFIGRLQRNKVKKVVAAFDWIDSVDSVALAEEISICSAATGRNPKILLQVNSSGESTKQGFTIPEALEAAGAIAAMPSMQLMGLMTIAPHHVSSVELHQCFGQLRKLRERLTLECNLSLPHLSMGMSSDYPVAIAEGATMVRIGTALFSAL